MQKQVLCPSCIGAKQVMTPKASGKKGFEYKQCDLCKGVGHVNSELAEDYELSLDEDKIEFDNESV